MAHKRNKRTKCGNRDDTNQISETPAAPAGTADIFAVDEEREKNAILAKLIEAGKPDHYFDGWTPAVDTGDKFFDKVALRRVAHILYASRKAGFEAIGKFVGFLAKRIDEDPLIVIQLVQFFKSLKETDGASADVATDGEGSSQEDRTGSYIS
jgi:hypothetical protein